MVLYTVYVLNNETTEAVSIQQRGTEPLDLILFS